MALLYPPKKVEKKHRTFTAQVQDLDYQGLGVAKIQGKTWFIENALPSEQVQVQVLEEKRQYGKAIVKEWLKTSPKRENPACIYYEKCGGCQTQHIPLDMQRDTKERALFQRLSKLQADPIALMPRIVGEQWHYRRRLRLSIHWDKKKGLLIGFRQKNSQLIEPVQSCLVIEKPLNDLLPKITALLQNWSSPKNLGHIELVRASNGIALLLRYQKNLAEKDRTLLCHFAKQENLMLFVQDDERIYQLYGESPYYDLKNGLRLHFDIRDFIQINPQLNQAMIDTALDWLTLTKQDRVLDLFCGMGNFTLPMSSSAKQVVGVEGVAEMVKKATQNAERNGYENVEFYQGDLAQSFVDQPWAAYPFNKVLLDPPRTGAAFAIPFLCELKAEKILYVSCNPATLVRDAQMLLQTGYQLTKVAMIDMFPNTGHLESISLFERK
ncbi:23S rRNA (uracil(1939)-C(5))-methyltransferase RlmD [Avibacterium paragallinarum]|uniref:23S rRNA (uracil(1939)-C(5))-methyltransferase RlmD n=1 Tax=Avibacterium paragallinarum TaxID=728 RepID=A0A380X5B9_AVIPA|nr:23S rRNA (uracil(1939)-C(5))-methyltransferase RlmD [Avibacterium paragallinarum]RZN56190.1 23S rRNA (uracil(1939)-C(5))-methyltransferase RlmD [Avibacterium paragallinarum]SUU98043.1 23S rRNA (uracil(1939)-C(5))-methyltransferase RlmD [Avibacterium paragallinarum]